MTVKVDHSRDIYTRICDQCHNAIPEGAPVFRLVERMHLMHQLHPLKQLQFIEFCGRYCAGIWRDRFIVSIRQDPLGG